MVVVCLPSTSKSLVDRHRRGRRIEVTGHSSEACSKATTSLVEVPEPTHYKAKVAFSFDIQFIGLTSDGRWCLSWRCRASRGGRASSSASSSASRRRRASRGSSRRSSASRRSRTSRCSSRRSSASRRSSGCSSRRSRTSRSHRCARRYIGRLILLVPLRTPRRRHAVRQSCDQSQHSGREQYRYSCKSNTP
jgi:hypothetical protein